MAAFLPIAAIGLTILGTLSSAAGAKQAASQSAAAANYNAAIAAQNAQIVRQQAQADAILAQREARQRIGTIRAQYGASGAGTPIDILTQSAEAAELDRQTIIYQGEVAATGYENQAAYQRFVARNAKKQGSAQSSNILLAGLGKAITMVPIGGFGGAGSSIYSASGGTAP
jgi:hypothetical protein